MAHFVGLDVSVKKTSVCVVDAAEPTSTGASGNGRDAPIGDLPGLAAEPGGSTLCRPSPCFCGQLLMPRDQPSGVRFVCWPLPKERLAPE
jgi:hypothetical protein